MCLKWLSVQRPVQLAVSEARQRLAPEVHMPSNPHEDEVWQKPKKGKARLPKKNFDLKTLLPVNRKKTALPIPAVVPDDPVAYFIWPNADATVHLETLRGICARVTYLGRSRSLVRVSIVTDPPPATYLPDPEWGQVQLRIPGSNRLKELIDNYKLKGGKPSPSPPHSYRRVGPDSCEQTSHTVFDRVFVFKPKQGDPMLPAVSTLLLTKALRCGLLTKLHERICGCDRWKEGMPRCEEARDCYRKIPAFISGYEENCSRTRQAHLAFVALPFVHFVQRHADGSIKGLAVLVPRNPDDGGLQKLAVGLMKLQENGLGIPGIGMWHLEEVPADDPPLLTLDARAWTKPSRIWTTVTPMVFGHFPKAKNGGEVKVILDSLDMVGIKPGWVVEIAVGRHSPLYGVPPSWCFKPGRGGESSEQALRRIRHVTLQFNRPVRGPIMLGVMRYFGLGLMQPLEE